MIKKMVGSMCCIVFILTGLHCGSGTSPISAPDAGQVEPYVDIYGEWSTAILVLDLRRDGTFALRDNMRGSEDAGTWGCDGSIIWMQYEGATRETGYFEVDPQGVTLSICMFGESCRRYSR